MPTKSRKRRKTGDSNVISKKKQKIEDLEAKYFKAFDNETLKEKGWRILSRMNVKHLIAQCNLRNIETDRLRKTELQQKLMDYINGKKIANETNQLKIEKQMKKYINFSKEINNENLLNTM